MDLNYQDIVMVGLNGISALACLVLFFMFFRFACGATWLKMLSILIAFDLIYHISRISYELGEKSHNFTIKQALGNFTKKFSMFWVLVIAYFLYRVLKSREFDKPNLYIIVSYFDDCSLYWLYFGVSWHIVRVCLYFRAKEAEDSYYFPAVIILRVVPFLLSTVPSIYFYFKARKFYKELAINQPSELIEKIMQTLFWFSLFRIPMLVFFLIFFDSYFDITQNFQNHHIIIFLADIPMSISGLLDCLIYFLRRIN